MLTRLRGHPHGRGPDDAGMTLVETLVAMALLMALMTVFVSLVTDVSRLTTRAQATERNADGARKIFTLLDQQVRSASAVNAPVRDATNGGWYLEFLTTAVSALSPPRCTQWRVTAGGVASWRTWNKVASPAPTPWRLVTDGVLVDTAFPRPFTLLPADATLQRQRLSVRLQTKVNQSPASSLEAVIVARNTGLSTTTNTLIAATGTSATEECTGVGRP